MRIRPHLINMFIAVLLISSCGLKNEDQIEQKIIRNNFSSGAFGPLGFLGRNDTLIITVESTECGEWGGNRDCMYLVFKDIDKISARLTIDTVPCDRIINKNGVGVLDNASRIIVFDSAKTINKSERKLISNMLQKTFMLYLNGGDLYNFGDIYQIEYTDGSMSFEYWNSGSQNITGYWDLRTTIFGEIDY